MRLRKLSAQQPYWWSGEWVDTLHWQLVADPIYSMCADCLRVWERGRERIVNLKWCVVKNSFVCSWQLKVKAWWLGHDKMFSNQASLGTTRDKSPSLLLFSHRASSGPLSFSLLSHYFSPHTFPIISSFLCFLSLFQHAVSPPATSLYLSLSYSFLIWRPFLSLMPHQCYSKVKSALILIYDFFLRFHLFAAHFSTPIFFTFFFMLHTFQFQHTF